MLPRYYKSKVAGSIPDGVIGIFRWHNPSDRTMALRSTQPVTEMSTRSIEPSARERPVQGFIPPLILSLFGYRLRIGHRGECKRRGRSRTGFPVRKRILTKYLLF